jgi:hypothetical protein
MDRQRFPKKSFVASGPPLAAHKIQLLWVPVMQNVHSILVQNRFHEASGNFNTTVPFSIDR